MAPKELRESLERLDSLTSEIEPRSEPRDWSELFSAISKAEALVPIRYKGVHVEFRDARRRLEQLRAKKRLDERWKHHRDEIRHIFYGRIEPTFEEWRASDGTSED